MTARTGALLLPLLLLSLPAAVQAQFLYVANNGTITITGYTGPGGAVAIPNVINGYPVTTIGLSAFASCTSLTSITIPDSVTSIQTNAFGGCTGLSSVTIPNSVTNIRMAAFGGCANLTSVTIGSGVTTIGDWAFSGCSRLINVTIPNSVSSLGHQAFEYCGSLTGVTIGSGVTSIGFEAFGDCTNLTSITVDTLNSAYSSVDAVLFNKTQTTLVRYPPAIAATSYTIPNGVTSIGDYAFASCASLLSVTIPITVTTIGNDAFYGCTSLTSITIPDSVFSLGDSAFAYCSSLTDLTIPNSVIHLAVAVFAGCSSLTTVTIGNSVTSIANWAFRDCTSLTSVTIGSGVTSIGDYVFWDCISLTALHFGGNAPSLGGFEVFQGDSHATVYYMPGTTGWGTTFGGLPTALWQPPPPTAWTLSASTITTTSATLNGTVNPNGSLTAAWFQWGTTTTYGNVTPVTSMGSGTNALALAAPVAGLVLGTTYHFRAAATNMAGVGYGSDRSFIAAGAGGMVTNCTEAALRAAMAGGGTVTFACDGTITLASTINIAADTTLDASGHQITISGNGAVRVFYVSANVDFTLINLTVANGLCNDRGAGMLNDGGMVNLIGVTFTGNCVMGPLPGGTGRGGAICNLGRLTVQTCSFLTNQARGAKGYDPSACWGCAGGDGGSGLGGALDNQGTATIASSTFAGNSAFGGPGGAGTMGHHDGGQGGTGAAGGLAVAAVSSQGSLGLVNCTFASNSAHGGPGGNGGYGGQSMDSYYPGGAGGEGGAGGSAYSCIYIYGEAGITNCTAAGNDAQPGAGGSGGGGGAGYPGDRFGPPTPDGPPGNNGPDGTGWGCFSRGPMIQGAPYFYTTDNGSITITGYTGAGGALTIPETINGLRVTGIEYGFELCASLTSVTIPNSVTSIGTAAFERCTSLTNVTIPDSVKNIGDAAFNACTSLTNITIPNSVTNIWDEAFQYCAGLTGIYFFGNAPMLGGPSVFAGDNNATVYYLRGTTGWGTTYGGRPTALWVQVPTIQTPPQTQTAEAGSAVNLWADASSPLPLFYSWYVNNTNLISRSTNGGLALAGVQFSQSGAYTVVISNALGAITSAPALLNVIALVERRLVPGVKVTGQAGSVLNVDYADSPSPAPSWTPLGSVSLTSTPQYYFDLTLPVPPQRYYRAWQMGTPGVRPSLDLHMIPAITLRGSIGGSLRLDYINRFGPIDAWVTLDRVTLTNTAELYFDTSSIGQPARLWRIVPVP